MNRNYSTQIKVLCQEISFGNLSFSNIFIIETYVNGILDYIIIPIQWEIQNFNSKEWDYITVKYANSERCNNINSYMADIQFAEITEENTLKLKIEPSGFHPATGDNIYLA